MERTRTDRRRARASAPLLVLLCGLAAVPAGAQQEVGGRYRVLVPALEPRGGAKQDFGRDVAEHLRKQIAGLPTHAPVERREFQEALRKYGLKESDLDCVKSRQLAVQMGAELVMCGEYEPAGSGYQVSATLIGARSGDDYQVGNFAAASPEEAAQRIFHSFESFITQLQRTRYCVDYLGSQQWGNALENCNRALELNPNSVTALFGKAYALMQLDSLPQSLQLLKRVLELNPVHGEALKAAGFVASRLNQRDTAVAYLRQYLDLNPGSVEVRANLASDLMQRGDPAGALQLLEDGLKQDSTSTLLRVYAGHAALAAAQAAEQQQGGADGAGERSPEVTELYGKALRHYEAVYAASGAETEVSVLRNLLLILVQLGRAQRAAELGAQMVAAKPQEGALWATYASALQAAGRLEEALAALDTALARDPNTPDIFTRRGLWLAQAGQLAQAREAFRKAVERQEKSSDEIATAIFGYGYTEKYRKGQPDEALDYFSLAREFATEPRTRAMTAFWSGFILYNRGVRVQQPQTCASAREALPLFQRALEFFQQSKPYTDTQPSLNLQAYLDGARRYIEIQEAVRKRGGC